MISDWIRGLRDPELLYKKLLLLAEQVEDSGKTAFRRACASVNTLRKLTWWCLLGAIVATVVASTGWILLWVLKVEASLPYQALVLVAGLAWAMFLTLVAFLLGAVEGIIRQFPRLERAFSDVREGIVGWLRMPAWIAFVALFFAVLMARFPALRKPESFLSLAGIVAGFGLASFLGVRSVSVAWLRRFVLFQLFIAVILLLIAPQFPHVTAWLWRQITSVTIIIGQHANPKQLTIDPDSPPPFFDAVSGKPLFWFSRRPAGGFALWDAPGFDPDTNEEVEPVGTKEKREEILTWLRAEARRNPTPVKVEPAPAPKRLTVRSVDDINFVNQTGSNILWYFGSQETGYELYDSSGFHRTGARLLPADSEDIRKVILTYFHQREQTTTNNRAFDAALASTGRNQILAGEKQSDERAPAGVGRISQGASGASRQERWEEFASEARRAIANDLLSQHESTFGKLFTVQCTSASQLRRRANAYGVNSDIVVVAARFRLSAAASSIADSRWLKTYEVSESIAADQFQGLTDADTIERVVGTLKEQIRNDTTSLSALRSAFKP
ncbi:MAG: hypothetical protein ACYC23_16555 [Limisphaerales bacterium]